MRASRIMIAAVVALAGPGCGHGLSETTTGHVDPCSAYDPCAPGIDGNGDTIGIAVGSAVIGAVAFALVRHVVGPRR